jgi:hypothetical protein
MIQTVKKGFAGGQTNRIMGHTWTGEKKRSVGREVVPEAPAKGHHRTAPGRMRAPRTARGTESTGRAADAFTQRESRQRQSNREKTEVNF